MNRITWLLLLGSAALAAAVAAMATRESVRSPAEELHDVRDRLARGRIDREEALYDLDLLVDRTLESGDPEFVARLRLSRARLLMEIAAWDRARDDLRVALGLGTLSPVEQMEVEDDLVDLHIRAGDYENGLNLVKVLLDRDPRDSSAWMRAGELHREKAQVVLANAREVITTRLVADEALAGERTLDRLGAMDPTDPRRPTAGHDLAALFEVGDEDRAQRILRLTDAAARENALARTAFATSLAVRDPRADPGKALGQLIDLLRLAGRPADAAEVGTCGLRMLQSRDDVDSVGLLFDVLLDLDRRNYAVEIGRWLVTRNRTLEPARLEQLADLFYRVDRWAELSAAASRMLQYGDIPEADAASLYSAIAQARQGALAGGILSLQEFLTRHRTEPFEGAHAMAWRNIGSAARRMRQVDLEREAVEAVIELDRDGCGPELLRLGALLAVSARGGDRQAEIATARAMNAMPQRTDELLPVWRRYGELELESAGMSASDVLTNPAWNRVFAGASNASVYELFVLSSVLLYKGQATRAEPYVRQINSLLPDFVPGIDLAARTMLKQRRNKDAQELLLRRMQLAGADAASREILASFPEGSIPLDRRIAFQAADPEGFGRRTAARGLIERGRPELAYSLLADGKGPNAMPEAREIAARALLRMGLAEEAFQELESLGRRATSTGAGLSTYVEAAARAGREEELATTVLRVARSLIPRRGLWLNVTDDMIARGQAAAALPLVRRLDSLARLRGGDVLVRLAWIQLAIGDLRGLAHTLERAEAFDTAGEAELVGLLACSRDPSWIGLEDAITRLKRSPWRPTRLQRAALLALEKVPEAARPILDAGIAAGAVDPVWYLADALLDPKAPAPHALPETYGPEAESERARLLAGEGADVAIDPRLLWCLILVHDESRAGGFIAARVRERHPEPEDPSTETPSGPGLWERWLLARGAAARRDGHEERAVLEGLVTSFPGFGPAWDRLEGLTVVEDRGPDAILDLRERRLAAMAERAGTPAETALDRARVLRRDGDLEGALAAAREAVELAPDSAAAQLALGRVHADRAEWKEAVNALVSASRADVPGSDRASTGALVLALEAAGKALPPELSIEERSSELEALEKRVPDDPRVTLALARMELEKDPRNPAFSVPHAVTRLRRFLGKHERQSLDTLAAGSIASWTDFLLALDPERARVLLQRERELDPAAIEPWVQLGRVRAALGEAGGRGDELETARRMAPVPDVLRAHARVRLAGSPTLQEIVGIEKEVLQVTGLEVPDPEIALDLARAYFGLGRAGARPALVHLNRLAWTPNLPSDLATEVSLLRAEVVLTTGAGLRAARIVSEVAGRIEDPYRATVALACESLAERASQN